MSGVNTGHTVERVIDETLRTVGVLFEPGDVIEIRALDVGRTPSRSGNTYAGYFTFENSAAIAEAIRRVDGKAAGVYAVLNRFNPELLARSVNHLSARPKNTTTDADITHWRWLYIDLDPIRPAGISSSDREHKAALEQSEKVREFLRERGWREPIFGDSGNGGHLLYRLPSDLDLKHARELVKNCVKALSVRFSDTRVNVDESTATPARLCKLYGTLTRKGDSTPDRPHRRSAILEEPERIDPVPLDALEALASEVAVKVISTVRQSQNHLSQTSFDIDQWLEKSGVDIVKGPEPYDGGRRWTLQACPFNPDHEKPVVIQLANGALVYKCLHKSCSEKDWKALRGRIEPGFSEQAQLSYPAASPNVGVTSVTASTSAHGGPRITDLSQLPSVFSLEAHLEWCVDKMIAEGSVTLLSAESGTGKTWVGYYLAGCVARGFPVLGNPVHTCKVLYLDGENPLYVVKQRLFDLGISETPNLTVWGGWNVSPPVGPEHPLVIEFARQHRGLIIYDSLIEFHPGSEQSSTETRAFMRHFRALANLGATVVILHHTGKAETSKLYRGSSDIKAAVDTAYLLASTTEEPKELRKLSMGCFKARLAPPQDFGMIFAKGLGFISCEAVKPFAKAKAVITEILSANPKSNQSKVVKLGLIEGCTKRQLRSCLESGPWITDPGPKNSTLYSVPEEPNDAT